MQVAAAVGVSVKCGQVAELAGLGPTGGGEDVLVLPVSANFFAGDTANTGMPLMFTGLHTHNLLLNVYLPNCKTFNDHDQGELQVSNLQLASGRAPEPAMEGGMQHRVQSSYREAANTLLVQFRLYPEYDCELARRL